MCGQRLTTKQSDRKSIQEYISLKDFFCQQVLYQFVCFSFRSVNQKIHARTRPTTVTNMLSVSTSVTSVTQCISASVELVMLEMVSCVERTPTWTDGQIKTWCVVLMLLITARRYVCF